MCPKPNCAAEFLSDEKVSEVTCPECFHDFCTRCQQAPHPSKSCLENAAQDEKKSILLLQDMKVSSLLAYTVQKGVSMILSMITFRSGWSYFMNFRLIGVIKVDPASRF